MYFNYVSVYFNFMIYLMCLLYETLFAKKHVLHKINLMSMFYGTFASFVQIQMGEIAQ